MQHVNFLAPFHGWAPMLQVSTRLLRTSPGYLYVDVQTPDGYLAYYMGRLTFFLHAHVRALQGARVWFYHLYDHCEFSTGTRSWCGREVRQRYPKTAVECMEAYPRSPQLPLSFPGCTGFCRRSRIGASDAMSESRQLLRSISIHAVDDRGFPRCRDQI